MGFHTETMQGWGRIWPENVQTFIGGLTNAELGIIVVADGGMTAISFDPPTTSDSILAAPQAQA